MKRYRCNSPEGISVYDTEAFIRSVGGLDVDSGVTSGIVTFFAVPAVAERIRGSELVAEMRRAEVEQEEPDAPPAGDDELLEETGDNAP